MLGESVTDAPKKLKGAKVLIVDLLEVSDEGIVLEESGFKFTVNFIDIKKANLEVNLFNELRKES